MAETPKTLIIEIDHYYHKLRFYFNDPNDERSWLIKKDNKRPWVAQLVREENRQVVDVADIPYSDFPDIGVISPGSLFILLVTRPTWTLLRLTKEKVQIDEVIIRYCKEEGENQ